MSWNPLRIINRQGSKAHSTQSDDGQLDKHVQKLEKLESASKKLMKDVNKYEECLLQVNYYEKKMTTDLSNSMLCQEEEHLRSLVEQWHANVAESEKVDEDLAVATEKTVIEPLKKFQGIFSEVNSALKKREKTMSDFSKMQQKVQKLHEKEKTGTNIVSLDTSTRKLATLEKEFKKQNEVLQEELPHLYEGRIEYFQPCLEAFIKAQVEHSKDTVLLFKDSIPALDRFSEMEFQEIQNRRLANIRTLSIIAE